MFDDLYQSVILDHYKRPANVGVISDGQQATNFHASCGDKVLLSVKVEGGILTDVRFEGTGCSISQASLSMMTEAVKGKPLAEVKELYEQFRSMLHGQHPDEDQLGDIVALQGVSKFPLRVPCATLGWETLAHLLQLDGGGGEPGGVIES